MFQAAFLLLLCHRSVSARICVAQDAQYHVSVSTEKGKKGQRVEGTLIPPRTSPRSCSRHFGSNPIGHTWKQGRVSFTGCLGPGLKRGDSAAMQPFLRKT